MLNFKHGLPLPDPRCTPGGVNPSVRVDILNSKNWHTGCIRDCETSESEKNIAYAWYKVVRPLGNRGEDQTCELDHLVPLELGGSDGLGNIWPQCGPSGVALPERYFKLKDRVENYLAEDVKTGRMQLADAQSGIAKDWTQYLDEANRSCGTVETCGTDRSHAR